MRLTPLDIRKQEFSRRMRGDDPDEVRAFLGMVAEQWDALLGEQRRLEERLRDQERKLAHYEQVEEALQEALRTARETARQARETAEARAAQIVREAEGRADEIKRQAEHDRLRLRREVSMLGSRRNEIAAKLRAFLMSELEVLAHFEGSDPVGFIKLLPSEGRAGTDVRLLPAEAAEPEGRTSAPDEREDAEEKEETEPGRPGKTREETASEKEAEGRTSVEERRAGSRPGPDVHAPPPNGRPRQDAAPEPTRSGRGWVNRPIISAPSAYGGSKPDRDASLEVQAGEGATRSGEEIEKIRRILRELD